MLITNIDKFIDVQFNLLNDYISRFKFNKSLKKDSNDFLKYFDKFLNTIDYSSIYSQISNDKYKKTINSLIEKYMLYYILLRFGINEENENNEKLFVEKMFIISNNYPVLDSTAISELVDIYTLYHTTVTLITILKKSKTLSDLPQNDSTIQIIQIFNDIGIDTIIDFFDISKKDGIHNILISLLIRKIYAKSDKKELTRIIEENNFSNAEFKYITIIESRIKEIDFASLEILFDIDQRKMGLPEDYYKLIDDYKIITLGDIEENLNPEYAIQSNLLSDDSKIAYLFHKKILIPITDEILRYNVNAEKYTEQNQDTKQNYKTDTKLNYIINKIHNITENARNPETKKIYYQPLYYRQAVPYNDIEELKIMKKFIDIGRVNADNVANFTDLLSFRVYPYINYNNFAHYGFMHKHYYTTEALRYTNFRFNNNKNPELITHIQNKYMQWRVITHDIFKTNNQHNFNSSIVGVAFPRYINFLPYDIRCLKINKSVNVRKYNPNGFKLAKYLLQKLITQNKSLNKTPFWIFDINTDKFFQDQYEDINVNDPQYFKKIISKIYDIVEELTLDRIINTYNMYSPLTLYQSKQILDIISKRLVPIPIYSDKMAKINFSRYFTYLPQRIETIDSKEVSFPDIELKKIPVYNKNKNTKVSVININNKETQDINILDTAVCQHTITLENIQKIREKDPTLFTKKLNEFYKRYVIDHVNSNFICNSCSQNINIDKYIYQYGDLIKISAESKIPLEEQKRYEKYGKAISALDKIIERMGSIFNLSEYMGNNPSSVIKRRETIRNLLDILLSSQELRSQNATEFDNETNILKEISGAKYSEYFAFPVENDIFIYSSRDTDKFKKMKYNTILTHIAVLMLLDINNSSILFLNPDKLINIMIFEKYGLGTLDNLKLRINTINDLVYLGNYLLLSYVIYYIASMMIRYKIYEIDAEVDVKKGIPPLDRLKIMHTIVHVLSIIVDRKIKKPDEYLYTILSTNYFIKLSNVFNSENSENTLKEIRYNIEKKINNDNQLTKKLVNKKHFMHEINGKLMSINPVIDYKSHKLYLRYFPNKKETKIYSYSEDELNNMIRKDLIWIYKNDNSIIKLNIDIFKLNDYTLKELYEIKKKYIENLAAQINIQKNNLNKNISKIIRKENKLNILYNNLLNDLSPFDQILDGFINKMEKYINESQSIYSEDFYLRKSVFIINHDIAGFPIKPIKIDKISIKYNDPTTKKDVIMYRDKNVERYYDIYNLAYLGYKEPSTNFVEIKNSQYLVIKYSLIDKIKYIGMYSKYVNILPLDKKIIYENNFRGDVLYTNQELCNQILQTKISHDKILIEKFQRIIFTIRNNNSNKNKSNNPVKEDITKEQKLIDEFSLRLQNLTILNESFILFLQNWKNVCSSYKFTPLINGNLINKNNNNYIDADTVINNDKYNILIKYLLLELISLIDMNTDKTNISLCSLISMIFDLMWKEYSINNSYEINTFLLILYSQDAEIINSSISMDDIPVIEEKENLTEEQKAVVDDVQQDFIEEAEAIDVEPMDEDERDLGDDTLATMMHDMDNTDNL